MKTSTSTKILTLDISSVSTGFAVFEADVPFAFGTITPKNKTISENLCEFRDSLLALIIEHKPLDVAIEALYRGPNAKTFKTLSMFHGVAALAIYDVIKKEPIAYEVKKVRRLAGLHFGTKFIDKKSVFEFFNERFDLGFSFAKGNDITDAMAIAIAHLNREA